MEERNLKEQILKSAVAVKKKVKMIKDLKNSKNMALEAIFKPIVDPLNQLANKTDEKNEQEESVQAPLAKKIKYSDSVASYSSNENLEEPYSEEENDEEENDEEEDDVFYKKSDKTLTVSPFNDPNTSETSFKSLQSSPSMKNQSLSWSQSSEVFKDVPFGIRNERGKLVLGKTRVYDQGNILKIGNRTLKKSDGITELLFKKIPNLDIVTDEDLQTYKTILVDTNAHRRNFDPNKPIKSNKGYKYMNVIKPLFKFSRKITTSTESLPQGEGINLFKKVKKDTDFIYWDDPNELVERLKLLLASREAGNTGVDNEIIAIIEELSEAGIINVKYKRLATGKLSSIITVNNLSRLQ